MAKYNFIISRRVLIEETYSVDADSFAEATDKVWEKDLLPFDTDWIHQHSDWYLEGQNPNCELADMIKSYNPGKQDANL